MLKEDSWLIAKLCRFLDKFECSSFSNSRSHRSYVQGIQICKNWLNNFWYQLAVVTESVYMLYDKFVRLILFSLYRGGLGCIFVFSILYKTTLCFLSIVICLRCYLPHCRSTIKGFWVVTRDNTKNTKKT